MGLTYGNSIHNENSLPECDVVLPFHNQLSFLREALDSLLAQLGVCCRIHVIDDGSTECTDAIRDDYRSHEMVNWYRNQAPLGPYRSLHTAVPYAESQYLAIQDADDVSLPQRLAKAVNALNETGADLFASAAREFLRKPGDLDEVRFSTAPRGDWGCTLLNATLVIRREFFQRINGFADFFCGADHEFTLRSYYAGARFHICHEPLIWKRRHNRSLSRSHKTGFSRDDEKRGSLPPWISTYRTRVRNEIQRRLDIFRSGNFDPQHYGVLQPNLSRTLGCVAEPAQHSIPI